MLHCYCFIYHNTRTAATLLTKLLLLLLVQITLILARFQVHVLYDKYVIFVFHFSCFAHGLCACGRITSRAGNCLNLCRSWGKKMGSVLLVCSGISLSWRHLYVLLSKTYNITENSEMLVFIYSNPALKGHSLERTPLYKGHKFLASSTVNACGAPSHVVTPLISTDFWTEGVSLLEGEYCIWSLFTIIVLF